MKDYGSVISSRVERLTRQLLEAQIEQMKVQLEGLEKQRKALDEAYEPLEEHGSGNGKERPAKGGWSFPVPGGAADKILKHFAKHPEPISVADLSKKFRISKGLGSQTTFQLKRKGLLHHDLQSHLWTRTDKPVK